MYGYAGVRWRKFMNHYDAIPNSILILNLAAERYLNTPGETSEDELVRIAHQIHEGTIELRKVRKKGIIEKTYRKFVDFYPTSLLIFVPLVLVIMSVSVSTTPDKQKKN